MRQRNDRRGATLVFVALSMTVLLGFAAFAVDLSQMGAYRSELQRAADAGAHAGAIQLTKTNYDSAAAIATSFAASNVVFGKAPTVDLVEYGTWNNATSTFTVICATGVTCAKFVVKPADAIRITVHGSGTNLFAGVLGFFGFTITTKAVGWAAPTVATSGCVKPFAAPYKMLTVALNRARGLADTYNPTRYPLEQADLDMIRDNPTGLSVCLKQGATGTSCTAAETGTSYPGNFQAVDLNPGDNGAADYESNIASGCASAGPGDALYAESGNMSGPTSSGKDTWCANFAPGACVMKAALYQSVAPSGTVATNGQNCTKGAEQANGSGWCYQIQMIGSFVVTDVSGNGANAKVKGYFTNAIDSGPIGGVAGTLQRPVIAQ
jgi:Flp pilus assembly protein TadG